MGGGGSVNTGRLLQASVPNYIDGPTGAEQGWQILSNPSTGDNEVFAICFDIAPPH